MLIRLIVCLALGQHLLCEGRPEKRCFWKKCYAMFGKDTKCFPSVYGCIYPDSPSDQGIKFLLYTNPDTYKELTPADMLAWNPNRDTKIIVHGFQGYPTPDYWTSDMARELLKLEPPVNVIVVDWKEGAEGPRIHYPKAVANCRVVGAYIASLILLARNKSHYSPSRFHIIGHSLGAHVAGYAGADLRDDNALELGRISGLDPAGPSFNDEELDQRLDSSDASFVDVIHTNAKSIVKLGLGMTQEVGHIDFFPNGGADMPGCQNFSSDSLGTKSNICSHKKAVSYFIASINDNNFTSVPEGYSGDCQERNSSCTRMGYHVDTGSAYRGRYITNTSSVYPF